MQTTPYRHKFRWSSYYAGRDIHQEYARKAKRHKLYFEAIRKLAGKGRVIEIGTGFGTCTVVLLIDYGLRPVSIDIDGQMLDMARNNHSQIAPSLATGLIQGSGLYLPFGLFSFNVAFSQGLLEHFDDTTIKRFVSEGLRVARYFAFSVPSCYFNDGVHLMGDERLLSKENWEDILSDCKMVESEYYCNREEYFAILKATESND